jgi:hypothetical protein
MCGVISDGGAAWYLRSTGDHDTHYGTWSGVTRTVHALCGIEFRPAAGDSGGTFVPNPPPNPDQMCPDCRSKATGPV